MSSPSPQDLAKASLQRAIALLDVNRAKDALGAIQESIRLDPEAVEPYCYRALALRAAGRMQDALEACDEAIKRGPEREWPHRLKSVTADEIGEYELALRSAYTARKFGPEVWQTQYCVASALYGLKRFGDSRAAAIEARTIAPDQAEPHILLGLIALERQELLEAEAQFRHALTVDPQNANAHNNLGTTLLRQGRTAEAVKFFGTSLVADPRGEIARSNLAEGAQKLRRQTFLLPSRKLFEGINPGVYQYYLDVEGRSAKVFFFTFLWKVCAPVTAVIALIAYAWNQLTGSIPLGWIIVAGLAINVGLLIAMGVFDWKRQYLAASAREVWWISAITSIFMNPLLLVAAGLAGLMFHEALWPLYITLTAAGGAFSIRLVAKRARGVYYRLLSRCYPLLRKMRDRWLGPVDRFVGGGVGPRMRSVLTHPATYVAVGAVGSLLSKLTEFQPLWVYCLLAGLAFGAFRFFRGQSG
jgi:tetratricopeptide (TPR) repeat protein